MQEMPIRLHDCLDHPVARVAASDRRPDGDFVRYRHGHTRPARKTSPMAVAMLVSLSVELDGKEVASLANGGTAGATVPAGTHEMKMNLRRG